MGLMGCPKMLVRNCHYWLHNYIKDCSSQGKRMIIKLLLLKNYRIQRLSHAKPLLLAFIIEKLQDSKIIPCKAIVVGLYY
jgi:hypothetical protein